MEYCIEFYMDESLPSVGDMQRILGYCDDGLNRFPNRRDSHRHILCSGKIMSDTPPTREQLQEEFSGVDITRLERVDDPVLTR